VDGRTLAETLADIHRLLRWPHCRLNVRLTHFDRIDDRQRHLLLECFDPALPELRLVIAGVQDGWRVALSDTAIDADRGRSAAGESASRVTTGRARDGPVGRQPAVKNSFSPSAIFSGVCGLSGGIA
jgi:hypothetical protein